MKRTLLLIGVLWCAVGLSIPAHGDEAGAATEPVAPAVLMFEQTLFADPPPATLPGWIARVGYEGGAVGGVTSAWRVAESAPVGAGKLWIDLDRSVLDENLAVSVVCERQELSDMVVQLWDDKNQVVALDLFGNIAAAGLESRTDTFVVPLRKYPSAKRVVLRRISGASTIYGVALIPVVTEKDMGTNTVQALQFARMLGDRLSPENELVRRVRVITSARSAATVPGQGAEPIVVTATRIIPRERVAVPPAVPLEGVQWRAGTPFPRACGMLAATVADGQIYAMGGYNGNWNSHVYRYDPKQPGQGWMSLSNMPMGRACLAAVTAGGRIYSIGGQGSQNDPAAVFVFDPKQPDQGWSQVSSLPVGLLRHAAVVANEKIYVMGGAEATGTVSGVYEYDPQQPDRGWQFVNSMPVALSSLAATVLDGKIHVIGGANEAGFSSAVYVFDPLTPEKGWVGAGTLPASRYVFSATTVGKRMYAVGGFNDRQRGIKTVYMYDSLKPDQGWVSVTDLPEVKGEAPVVAVNGELYIIAGSVAPCSPRASVYVGTLTSE
jgi:N-acetylneuraminic acid mutarotase